MRSRAQFHRGHCKERTTGLVLTTLLWVVDWPVSSERPDPNDCSGLAGTHVRQEGASDVQAPENISVELVVSLFGARGDIR